MQHSEHKTICPRCGSLSLKRWDDLTDDERFVIERVPAPAQATGDERKKHRFCTRCMHEDRGDHPVTT